METKNVMSYPESFWSQRWEDQAIEYLRDVFGDFEIKVIRSVKESIIECELNDKVIEDLSTEDIKKICINLDLIRIRGNNVRLDITNGHDYYQRYNVKMMKSGAIDG